MNMGDKKTTSLKQIEANHNNSLKSTGPKTLEGKAKAKMNAMKHGLLSDEVVVRCWRYKESVREYRALKKRYWQELAPVGPVEESLVEQIVANRWRQRRVLTAENGEITLSVDTGAWGRMGIQSGERVRLDGVWMNKEAPNLKLSATGVDCLTDVLEFARLCLEEKGELTEEVLQDIKDAFNTEPYGVAFRLFCLDDWRKKNPDKLEESVLKEKYKTGVLKCIEEESAKIKGVRELLQ